MPVDLLLVLIVILILVVIWRGPKTMPRIGEALGRGVKEARIEASKAQAEIQARASADSSTTTATSETPTAASPAQPDQPAPPTPPAPTGTDRPS
jgi:Sec-independent protein translocase protein TatA